MAAERALKYRAQQEAKGQPGARPSLRCVEKEVWLRRNDGKLAIVQRALMRFHNIEISWKGGTVTRTERAEEPRL